jgi:pimeloyl-ACP methyl ester carboxylesterase
MRRIPRATTSSIALLALLAATTASAGASPAPRHATGATGLAKRALHLHALGAAVPARAASAAVECPGEGVCRFVSVPLNRDDPDGRKIAIRYEVYAHTDRSQPPLPPIFLTEGGPGASIINDEFAHAAWVGMLSPLNGRHDIVLVDQRGVGGSQAINCPSLQDGGPDFFAAVAACGRQLGTRSDLYGSADVAADLDAVRRAIGARKIDFFGSSYAAVDIQAYAVRYPDRLHRVVLDSPAFTGQSNPQNGPQAALRTATELCRTSGTCALGRLHPRRQIAWLAQRLRAHPLDGVGIDPTGGRHRIHLTEGWLAWRILQSEGAWLAQSEVAAAAVALRRGDTRPLLRLAAENDATIASEPAGDPTVFSAGTGAARFCTDVDFPWDEHAPFAERRRQWEAYKDALPRGAFAPFSVEAWLVDFPIGAGPTECIGWPAGTHDRPIAVPPGSHFPDVPALVLSGSIDQVVPTGDARQVAAQFPRATFVEVTGSGHDTTLNFSFECVQPIVVRFLRTVDTGDTSCTRTPHFKLPAVGAFPLRLDGERQALADPSAAGDESTRLDRKAVSATWDAIRDSIWHTYIFGNFPESAGPGLRGGNFVLRFDLDTNVVTANLHGVGFTRDLAVTGTVTHSAENELDARVRLTGRVHGRLRLTGLWLRPDATTLRVRGTIGGRRIEVVTPAG